MADDKTTKTPEQPVTDTGPGKETPPAPPKEPEKASCFPGGRKKRRNQQVKNPQVSVYNFAEIMKGKESRGTGGSSRRGKACPGKNGETGKAAGGSEKGRGKTGKAQRAGTAEAPGPSPESRIRTRPQPRSPKLPHRKTGKGGQKETGEKNGSNGAGRSRSEGTREAEGCSTPGQGTDRLYQAERAPRLQEPSL